MKDQDTITLLPLTGAQPVAKRRPDEVVVLLLSAIGTVSIFPFAVYRFLQADWGIAVIDLIVSILLGSLFVYVFRTHKTENPNLILAIIFLAATILTIYFKGASQVYWAYPATMATFFLLSPKKAAVLTSVDVLLVLYLISLHVDNVTLISISITLISSNVFAFIFAARTRSKNDQLMQLATHDPLTGASNRRALEKKLEWVVQMQQREKRKISLIILDLDHFKRINDRFGHAVGDNVLVRFVELIRSQIRKTDTLFRFGGEEFVVIAENTEMPEALQLAEKLRSGVENTQLLPGEAITTSVGVADYQSNENRNAWFKRADKALFEAKQLGRNQVVASEVVASETPASS